MREEERGRRRVREKESEGEGEREGRRGEAGGGGREKKNVYETTWYSPFVLLACLLACPLVPAATSFCPPGPSPQMTPWMVALLPLLPLLRSLPRSLLSLSLLLLSPTLSTLLVP